MGSLGPLTAGVLSIARHKIRVLEFRVFGAVRYAPCRMAALVMHGCRTKIGVVLTFEGKKLRVFAANFMCTYGRKNQQSLGWMKFASLVTSGRGRLLGQALLAYDDMLGQAGGEESQSYLPHAMEGGCKSSSNAHPCSLSRCTVLSVRRAACGC